MKQLQKRLRMLEAGMSRAQTRCDEETRASLAVITDDELSALIRAHDIGADENVLAILEKLECHKRHARLAK